MGDGLIIAGEEIRFAVNGRVSGGWRLSEDDRRALAAIDHRYRAALGSRRGDTVMRRIGADLFRWLDGDHARLDRRLAEWPRPVVFEVRGPRVPSDLEWLILNAPFELLIRPTGDYLVVDPEIQLTVVRRLGLPQAVPPPVHRRLRVAYMSAEPPGTPPLDFEAEESAILEALGGVDVEVMIDDTGDPDHLGRRLAETAGTAVVHLACHGTNGSRAPGSAVREPTLSMETADGAMRPVGAADLVPALAGISLVVLTSCLTASAPDGGAPREDMIERPQTHSVVTELIAGGVPAVVGWDGTVQLGAAIAFNGAFYGALSRGVDTVRAVGAGLRQLLSDDRLRLMGYTDWHRARLWIGPAGGSAIVGGSGDETGARRDTRDRDRSNRFAPLPSPDAVVGRRRWVRELVVGLLEPTVAGAILYGSPLVGKSALAARIADRMVGHRSVVVAEGFTADDLVAAVEAALSDDQPSLDRIRRYRQVAADDDALRDLLVDLTGVSGNRATGGVPLLVILDGLERVLVAESTADVHVVDPRHLATLSTVFEVFAEESPSRLVVTTRAAFHMDARVHYRFLWRCVDSIAPDARLALTRRQVFDRPTTDIDMLGWGYHVATLARGNPGIQAELGRIVLSPDRAADDAAAALSQMETYLTGGARPGPGPVADLVDRYGIDALVAGLAPDDLRVLRAAQVVDGPVPDAVLAARGSIDGRSPIRLHWCGVLRHTADPYRPDRPAYELHDLMRGRLGPLDREQETAIARTVIDDLFSAWGGADARYERGVDQNLLLIDLALRADYPDIVTSCCTKDLADGTRRTPTEIRALLDRAVTVLVERGYPVPTELAVSVGLAALDGGDLPRAQQMVDTAMAAVDPDGGVTIDPALRATVETAHARLLVERGDRGAARSLLAAVRRRTGTAHHAENVSATRVLVDVLYADGHDDEVVEHIRTTLWAAYHATGDLRRLAAALGILAKTLYRQGRRDEAVRVVYEQLIPLYRMLRDYTSGGDLMAMLLDGDLADPQTDRGAEFDDRLGELVSAMPGLRGLPEIFRELSAAEGSPDPMPVYERARTRLRQVAASADSRVEALFAVFILGMVEMTANDCPAAYRLLSDAYREAQHLHIPGVANNIGTALAECLTAMGRTDEAHAVLAECAAAAERDGMAGR
ncbi:CHAT domain-containing protein [Millisia brevis]|uniref:CHAT domain-containing protein n=1 Tax=Millisia brevis TaxID=264148 RepID=UPI000834FFE6|nr:CHAT domain-containing protein [Millisia brevis]